MKTRVLEICKKRGISLGELADKMGIKQANLSQSLNHNPTLNTLQSVADNLNVNISDLFEKKETGVSGFLEVNGQIKKISGPIDLIPIVGTFGVKSYTNYKVCKNELREFIKKSQTKQRRMVFSGILEGKMLFAVTYNPSSDGGEYHLAAFSSEHDPIFIPFDEAEYWGINNDVCINELTNMMWAEIVGGIEPNKEYTDQELEEKVVY